jgi:hypothetical protein
MTDPAVRQRAALAILDRLPQRWRVGPATYAGRLRPPETLTGRGAKNELPAMADLRILTDERQRAEKLELVRC